jgi:hypothetical protein
MDDINRMAREAGGLGYVHDAGDDPHKWQFTPIELQTFTALAQAAEREACAKLAWTTPEPDDEYVPLRMAIHDAIRARGQA